MEWLKFLLDLFLHLDQYLGTVVQTYGSWTYLLLFFVIFMETGFVVTPFLPGDSLLFAAGTFAAMGWLNVALLFLLMATAAILGDTVNYWIGHYIGPRAFSSDIRFLKREHLNRTHEFFEKHGGKAVVLARFVPIVRTFAPFVAGVGAMTYSRFIFFNVLGGLLWVFLFLFGGYFFGNLPFVQHNFELVILAIIGLSVVPMITEYLKERRKRAAGRRRFDEERRDNHERREATG